MTLDRWQAHRFAIRRSAADALPSSRFVLLPILTLLLLVFAFACSAHVSISQESALPTLAAAWLGVMVVNFVIADVGDADDVGAFVLSAFVILLLAYGLWRLGGWLARRRK